MDDHQRHLTAILEAIAAIPASVNWTITPIHSLGLILLVDDRDEATTIIVDAIASQHGEVVANASVSATVSGRELAGCLVQPAEIDLEKAAGILRLNYALGIGAGQSDDETHPF